MKKKKFETYNDGVILFGDYVESYDENNNATNEKEFSIKGKLFFSYQAIREQDGLKYDNTGFKVNIKIKTKYLPTVKSSYIISLNNKLYSIAHIEPDNKKENLYIFLTELINTMDKHIEIYSKVDNGPLKDYSWELYRIVWGDVANITSATTKEYIESEKLKAKVKKKFTIRYMESLDPALDEQATIKYSVKYKNFFYDIINITNISEKDELLELEVIR